MAVIRLVVRGRVQGVGFRWFVREAARALDVGGSVRNEPDGSVELVASGTPEAVARLVAAVREGPPGAVVAEVTALDASHLPDVPFPFQVER